MDNSKFKNTHVLRAAKIMSNMDNDEDTDTLFSHKIDKYEMLLENDAGEIPENIELLRDNTALTAFIRMALSRKENEINIDDLTDRLANLDEIERNQVVQGVIDGVGENHIKSYLLPLGCEID